MREQVIMKQEKEFRSPEKESVICALLEKKLTLCKKIVDVSQTLQDALVSRNIVQIAEIVAQRQEYMDKVDETDETIMKFRVHGLTDIQAGIRRIRMKCLLSDIEDVLQKTIPLNQACERSAAQILDIQRGELQQMQWTRQAYHGYAGGKPSPARFFDVNT